MNYQQVLARPVKTIRLLQLAANSKRLLIFFCLTALLLQPMMNRPALAFSVGEEKKVGDKLLSMVRTEFTVIDAPDITQYINNLGQRILKVTGPQYFNYHFFIINNKDFNAFAAPSGLIFIHSGLLEAMDNEGELVSVMAHEVGHVTSRHISKQVDKSKKTSIGTAALLIAGIAMGGGAIAQALISGSMAANASMNLRFSRQDEEEADRLSYKWMLAMNMSPAPMATMLQKMYKISVYQMANTPPFLLTHPEPRRRLEYIQDMLLSSPPHSFTPRDDFAFLRVKYRIMVSTKDPAILRPIFLKQAREALEPQKTMANYGLYLLYMDETEYSKAKAALHVVIKHFGNKAILRTDLGLISLRKGAYRKALDNFQQAIAASPDDAYTAYNQAKALERLGEKRHAIQIYKRLITVIPDFTKLRFQLGKLLSESGQTGAGHYQLGRFFWLNGDHKSAKYHFKQAIKDKTSTQTTIKKSTKQLEKIKEIEKE